jgi:hypothetical protein
MTAGLPKLLNSLWKRLPKGFFVLRCFLSICGLVIKKYMGGGDKKETNALRIILLNSNYFTVGVKNEPNFKSFDACHATRHTGSWCSIISGSQITPCDPDGQQDAKQRHETLIIHGKKDEYLNQVVTHQSIKNLQIRIFSKDTFVFIPLEQQY